MLTDQPRRVGKTHRRTTPTRWLMTDRRLGNAAVVARIVARMPPRSGIIIRPYAMGTSDVAQQIRIIRRIATARRHCVLIAGGQRFGGGWAGVHGIPASRHARDRTLLSLPVHDAREAARAVRLGAAISLVSPVFATRSHPGAMQLGQRGFARLGARTSGKIIALGGMDAVRFRTLRRHGAHGWAAIDAWLPQNP